MAIHTILMRQLQDAEMRPSTQNILMKKKQIIEVHITIYCIYISRVLLQFSGDACNLVLFSSFLLLSCKKIELTFRWLLGGKVMSGHKTTQVRYEIETLENKKTYLY